RSSSRTAPFTGANCAAFPGSWSNISGIAGGQSNRRSYVATLDYGTYTRGRLRQRGCRYFGRVWADNRRMRRRLGQDSFGYGARIVLAAATSAEVPSPYIRSPAPIEFLGRAGMSR